MFRNLHAYFIVKLMYKAISAHGELNITRYFIEFGRFYICGRLLVSMNIAVRILIDVGTYKPLIKF